MLAVYQYALRKKHLVTENKSVTGFDIAEIHWGRVSHDFAMICCIEIGENIFLR